MIKILRVAFRRPVFLFENSEVIYVTEKDIMTGAPGEGSYVAKVISKGLYNKVDK